MDYFDQIDEYLNDALSESDKIAFEVAMATDAKLKQAVDDHEVAMDVVGSILEGEVRSLINNEELKINSEERGIENGGLKIENGGAGEGDQEVKERGEGEEDELDEVGFGCGGGVCIGMVGDE